MQAGELAKWIGELIEGGNDPNYAIRSDLLEPEAIPWVITTAQACSFSRATVPTVSSLLAACFSRWPDLFIYFPPMDPTCGGTLLMVPRSHWHPGFWEDMARLTGCPSPQLHLRPTDAPAWLPGSRMVSLRHLSPTLL